MAPSRAASARQLELLLEFAEKNSTIALGGLGGGPLGRQVVHKKWEELSRKLNSVGAGCNKTPVEWKRYWTLLKSRTKGKAGDLRRAVKGTGGGPNISTPLTPLEERIICIIGKVAVEGEPQVQIPINIPDLPTISTQPTTSIHSSCPSPGQEVIIDEQLSDYTTEIEEPSQILVTHNPLHISPALEDSQSIHNVDTEIPQDSIPTSTLCHQPEIRQVNIPTSIPRHQPEIPQLNIPTSTPRRRPLRSVENAPQWAIDVENRRIESHTKIVEEIKGIKEAIHAQTVAINRVGDLLSALIEKSNAT